MRKKYYLLIGFTLCLMIGYVLTQSILSNGNVKQVGNGKIAVLQSSAWKWSDKYDHSDYLSQERTFISALDFYGYKYDILNYEDISDAQLAPYEAVIAEAPITSTASNLVIDYTRNNQKYAFVAYAAGRELYLAYGLDYVGDAPSNDLVNTSSFSGSITEGLDGLDTWYYAAYSPGPYSNVNIRNLKGNPAVVTSTVNGGTCVFFLNRISSTSHNNYRLIKNFCNIATNNMPVVTGSTPYAKDLVILLRYDDLITNPVSFQNLYNISHDCTIAAVINATSLDVIQKFPLADVEPHSYDHIDLTTLNYSGDLYEMTAAYNSYYSLMKKHPNGLIAPYNNINENVTNIAMLNDYKWLTWNGAVMDDPCHYYSSDTNDKNSVWILGDEGGITLSQFIDDPATIAHYKETRSSLMLLDHPEYEYQSYMMTSTENGLLNLIKNSSSVEGLYFSNISDYVSHLNDARKVNVLNNTIVVSDNVGNGLTFNGLSSNLVFNGNSTIFERNNKVLLPELTRGTYNFTTSNSYPHIINLTNSSSLFLVDGYYNITSKNMYFTLHRDNELFNTTNITIYVPDNNEYSLNNGLTDERLISQNGILTVYNVPQGSYILKCKSTTSH
ncbi:MAG: Polysaccharide deacetylase family protein [Euryarchaeota archaeon]|nr:Polysaccharide deacetylase family protein [Euryarchaeota archaeon]